MRLSDVERQNSILLNAATNSNTNVSVEVNKGFVGKILKAVASLVNEEKYRYYIYILKDAVLRKCGM